MSTGCYTADCASYTARKEYSFDAVPHVIVDEVVSDLSVRKKMPKIKQIIINPPATIIIWKDGTKTVCKSNEEFDPEVGVAMCIAKKYFGSRNQFAKAVEGAVKDFEKRTWG